MYYRSFEKVVDDLRLEMSEPAPRWVSISHTSGPHSASISGLQVQHLRDLRYLIDCALAFVDEDEQRVSR